MTTIKRNRIATSLIFLFSGIAVASWAPMVPFAKTRLDLSEATLGLILLLFGIGALLTMPLTGWLVSKWGSRIVTLVAGVNVLWLIPFLTIAPTVLSLTLALFLFGALTGALNVSMNAHALLLEKEMQKPIMSRFHSLFSGGGLLGALFITLLLEQNCSLFFSAIVIAIILGILLFSQFPHIKSLANKIDSTPKTSTELTFPSRIFAIGALCFILFLTEGAMLDWSALYLRTSLNYNISMAGLGFALFSIAMAIGRFFGDKIVAYLGPIFTVQIGSVISALGVFITLYITKGYSELFGFLLIGLGAANIVPILFSSAGSVGNSASYSLTIVTTCGYAGLLLGPAFIGGIAEATTLSFALTLLIFLMGSVGLSASFLLQPKKREQIL